MPVDQWAQALDLDPVEWGEAHWFSKPTPDDIVVLHGVRVTRTQYTQQTWRCHPTLAQMR